MEFGCRYIYVDESRRQNEVQLESHLSPITASGLQNDVVLGPHFYDNFQHQETSTNDAEVNGNGNGVELNQACYDVIHHAEQPSSDTEVKGLLHCRVSPESNVHHGLQTTFPVQLEGQKIPPPVPQRKKKESSPSAPPGFEELHCRFSPESNVYKGLQPTCPVKLDGKKTPPPVPCRRKMSPGKTSTSSPSTVHHATNRSQTEQPTIIISSTVQNSQPPVPDRKKKPSLYKPSDVTPPETLIYDYATCEDSRPNELPQDDQYYVDLPPVAPTDFEQIVQPGMKKPLIHHMSDLPRDVSNDRYYLYVLPALPTELRRQATPVKPPDRPVATAPVPPTERLPANCNILLLNIGKMVEDSDTCVRESPVLCIGCSATFSKLNHADNTKTWTCVFCAAENPLPDDNRFESREEGDELYTGDHQLENEYSFADQTMIIFCIDISGSMSVTTEVTQDQSNDCNVVYKTRMETVKSALDQTLDFLHQQHSGKRVALVTFSDQVKLYGDGTIQPLVLQGAELLDPDHLKSRGEDQPMPHQVTETLHALKGRIQCLEEKGATALGPAALISIAMASKSPGSKVIICTDGRANTDLGNLEDISEEDAYKASKLYYSNSGDLALQHRLLTSTWLVLPSIEKKWIQLFPALAMIRSSSRNLSGSFLQCIRLKFTLSSTHSASECKN